jgi:hypothetical protein
VLQQPRTVRDSWLGYGVRSRVVERRIVAV